MLSHGELEVAARRGGPGGGWPKMGGIYPSHSWGTAHVAGGSLVERDRFHARSHIDLVVAGLPAERSMKVPGRSTACENADVQRY